MTLNLYELTESWMAVQRLLDDEKVPISDVQAAIDLIETNIEDKADNYAKLIKSLEGESETIGTEIKRLDAMKRTRENKVKWLKDNLESAMIATNRKKFKTQFFSFNVQKNAPRLQIATNAIVPEEWYETTRQLRRRDLLNAIKDGKVEAPAGVSIVQTESLRIR